ncbi:ribbon-helix-helix domain-containing protein [Tardiphaga robiniae]|uniref:Ribbon-helix-helix domain-containing protein n=1 Tax=Tardiphaga robiniae TaxID=943830 RepID=A0A7G6U391_9BRAD|nr:ribbon-helix-helix domain-containing protein [Tardiphaga robiniae]QND73473.1 ribbon-helix-helix domain-containing protein [Tardiphaga robiniae]
MGYEAAMNRPNVNRKRSVVVSKKRTSVSLEDSFWASLQAIVRMENTTIEHYIEKIERKRETPNLSSNLRIAVLEYFQQIAARSLTAGTADQPTASSNAKLYDNHNQLAEKVAAYWGREGSQNQQLVD